MSFPPANLVVFLFLLISLSSCTSVPTYSKVAIATAHPLATQAGLDILNQGGNAFDAAVAVSAVLAVVEPTGSGLGGGGFWLLHREHDNFQIMIDGRETAPNAAHRDMYLGPNGENEEKLSLNGPLAAGIPGLPAALDHINQKYGRLSLKQTLAPAIVHAKSGFKVTSHYQSMAQLRFQTLQNSPAAAEIFLEYNSIPKIGHVIRQLDLAHTLEQLASLGKNGFYQGAVANKLIQGVQAAGGIWTQRDLRDYQVKERQPIIGTYQDYKITSASLPSSGGIVLSTILNQLEHLPMSEVDEAQQRHFIIEAMRRAYFDRSYYLGDSDFVTIPGHLSTKAYAQNLAATINADRASHNKLLIDDLAKGEDTTHFSIIDQYGNRVAATLSINYPFGSGFVPPGTGVLLNDEMDDFSARIGTANVYGLVGNEANSIAANKRPLSSMSPTFIENDQHLMIIGTPGGSRIITMVLLGILDFIEQKPAKDIVSSPRFHHQYLPNKVQIESSGFSKEERQAILAYGHDIQELTRQYGNMQIIIYDKITQELEAASDPRGEGQARVESLSH